MTWGEFKRMVEEQGLKDSDEIEYIDWTTNNNRKPTVGETGEQGLKPSMKAISQ